MAQRSDQVSLRHMLDYSRKAVACLWFSRQKKVKWDHVSKSLLHLPAEGTMMEVMDGR